MKKDNVRLVRRLLTAMAVVLSTVGWIGHGRAQVPDVTLELRGAPAVPGGQATVDVNLLQDTKGAAAVQFDVADPLGILTLRSQSQIPPGGQIGTDAAAAGKDITVVAVAGGFRVTIFGFNVNVIPDLNGDTRKAIAKLVFDVRSGAPLVSVPLQVTNVVVADALGVPLVVNIAQVPTVIRASGGMVVPAVGPVGLVLMAVLLFAFAARMGGGKRGPGRGGRRLV